MLGGRYKCVERDERGDGNKRGGNSEIGRGEGVGKDDALFTWNLDLRNS